MEPKLTIGSAIYNLDESILRAHIEGIIPQLTDETELLLIDDCSTNNAGDVCREYAEKDSRIRYIRQEKNGGLARVRNRTVEEAAGKWILFADGDDLLSDYFVETALRFSDTDADIIIHERLKFIEEKQSEEPCAVRELTFLPNGAGRALSISCLCLSPTPQYLGLSARAFYHAAWGGLYKKEFLCRNELLFPAGQKKAQDAVFNTHAYSCAEKIAYLPYVMYYYRGNPQGITHRYSGNLPEIYKSLLGHLGDALQKYYADDAAVQQKYTDHRVMACVIDNMRLDFFHKDNPHSREERRQAFLSFIDSAPYKQAIADFDPRRSGRWEWALPVKLISAKNFAALDLFVGNEHAYSLLCGIYKRAAMLIHH